MIFAITWLKFATAFSIESKVIGFWFVLFAGIKFALRTPITATGALGRLGVDKAGTRHLAEAVGISQVDFTKLLTTLTNVLLRL